MLLGGSKGQKSVEFKIHDDAPGPHYLYGGSRPRWGMSLYNVVRNPVVTMACEGRDERSDRTLHMMVFGCRESVSQRKPWWAVVMIGRSGRWRNWRGSML